MQAVADAKLILPEIRYEFRGGVIDHLDDGELGPADFLPPKQVTDRLDGLKLVVQIRLKM